MSDASDDDERSKPGLDERNADLARMRARLQRGRDSMVRAKRMLDKLNRRPKAATDT